MSFIDYGSMKLHFEDKRKRVVDLFLVSLHMPQRGLPVKDYINACTFAKFKADIKETSPIGDSRYYVVIR